jgi:hypothetical protein
MPQGSYEWLFRILPEISVHSTGRSREATQKPPCRFTIALCISHAAFKKPLNTTARGFRKIGENS